MLFKGEGAIGAPRLISQAPASPALFFGFPRFGSHRRSRHPLHVPPQALEIQHPHAAVLDADQSVILQRLQGLVDTLA